jgi:hypothetical protein
VQQIEALRRILLCIVRAAMGARGLSGRQAYGLVPGRDKDVAI